MGQNMKSASGVEAEIAGSSGDLLVDPESLHKVTPSIIAVLIVLLGAAYLLSGGDFHILGLAPFSTTFDSLAQNLLKGYAHVAPDSISWEGFVHEGKKYTYFGPWPAIIRIPLNLIAPENYGKWCGVSILLSISLSLTMMWLTTDCLVARNKRASVSPHVYKYWQAFGLVLLVFGSPLMMVVAAPRIYHEPIAWGMAGVLTFFYFLFRYFDEPDDKILLGLSVAFTITFLSRLTFALPQVLILAWIVARRVRSLQITPTFAGALLPGFFAGCLQLWYNQQRFGSIFKCIDYSSFYTNPVDYGGSFNLFRIPVTFWNYMFPFQYNFSTYAPYFRVSRANYLGYENLFFQWRETVPPMLLASPLLLLTAYWGVRTIYTRKSSLFHWYCSIAFFIQSLLILSFYFVTQRYATELMAFLLFNYFYWVRYGSLNVFSERKWQLSMGFLSVVSVYITCVATLQWQSLYAHDTTVSPNFKSQILSVLVPAVPPQKTSIVASRLPTVRIRGNFYDYTHARLLAPNAHIVLKVPQGSQKVSLRIAVPDDQVQCDQMYGRVTFRDSSNAVLATTQAITSLSPVMDFDFDLPVGTALNYITVHFESQSLPWTKPGKSCPGAVAVLDPKFEISAFR